MKRLVTMVATPLILIGHQPVRAQQEPANLKDFGLICFCTSRVATPHGLVSMDNNGRILNLARRPMTKSEMIAAGEPVTDSQLRMLRDWGLLTKSGDRFETNFPVLGPREMAALRARIDPLADSIAAASVRNVDLIVRELKRRRQPESAYAVLFGYVLDGLVWRDLEAAGKLPKQEIRIERPFWDGTFWAVWPRQDASPGTNDLAVGNAGFRMMWTLPVVDRYSALANAPATRSWLEQIGRTPPGSAVPAAPAGSPFAKAVIVDERETDPIFEAGKRIAGRTALDILATRLDDVLPKGSDSDRILIATHELIWMVLDRAARRVGIAAPAVTRTGAKSDADLAPLLIVTIKPAG